MRIAMIGTGYVGLVSGACIADFGHEVTCVDKDGTKISALNSGEIPIYEPGLKDIVQSNVRQGRLQFTTALSEALKGANAAFIAVGTPSRRGDGHADLSYVYESAREIHCFEEAAKWAIAILKVNRCDEEAHRLLIQIYGSQGRRLEAFQQYQRCEHLLREELGVAPFPETTRIFQKLLTSEPSSTNAAKMQRKCSHS